MNRLSRLQSFNGAMTLTAGKVVIFVTFMLFLVLGGQVSSRQVFSAMMLYETLRVSLSILLPSGLLYARDMLSTVARVQVSNTRFPSADILYRCYHYHDFTDLLLKILPTTTMTTTTSITTTTTTTVIK